MVHSDARIERVLTALSAGSEARQAADDLFEDYTEFTDFYATIFFDWPAGLAVSADLADEHLRSGYGVEQDIVPTLSFLELAYECGFGEDANRVATFFRMSIALHPHRAFDARQASQAYDRVAFLPIEQFAVFHSYDIMDLSDAFFAETCLSAFSLPMAYVVGAAPFLQYGAACVHAMYSHGVPIEYAVAVESAYGWSENQYNTPPLYEAKRQFPNLAASLHLTQREGSDAPIPAWHIIPLYLNLVPAEYAKVVVCRTAAETIMLYEAGVAAEYAMALADLTTADILMGHRDGLAAEYLRELDR